MRNSPKLVGISSMPDGVGEVGWGQGWSVAEPATNNRREWEIRAAVAWSRFSVPMIFGATVGLFIEGH